MTAALIPFTYCAITGAIYAAGIARRAHERDGAGAVISAALAAIAFLSAWIVL